MKIELQNVIFKEDTETLLEKLIQNRVAKLNKALKQNYEQ